jgi:putative PEP-CTERM system TPR-repeat lipoprotein
MDRRTWLVVSACLVLVGGAGCDRTTAQDHVERAQEYRASHDPRSAVIELKNALRQEPNLAEARLALGEVDLELGDYPSALKELERALDLGVDQARVMPPLLEAKLEHGSFQEVLGAVDSLQPTPRADVIRGRALLMSGDAARAKAAFQQALEADPKSSMALIGLAQVALSANDPIQASALLAQAVTVDPRNRRAWLAQADLQALQSHLDQALVSYQTAADLPALDLLPELGVARVLVLQGKLTEGEAAVDAVLARAPDYPIANYFKGLIAFQREDYKTAEGALRKVQQRVPDHPPTLLLMGTVKFRQGENAQAESQIGRYLTFDPNNVSARKLLAAIRLSNDNATGAVEALEPIAASLQDAQGLALLGTAYMRAGQLDKATADLQQAVALAPDMASLRNQLALSLIASGENKDAISQLETAVSLKTDVIQSDILLIMMHLRESQFEQALDAAKQMTERNPKSPIAFNLLGAAYLANKDQSNAIKAFEQALVIDRRYSPAAINLAKLAQGKGDIAGARKRLETLLAEDPVNLAALMALAEIALTARDVQGSKDYLERARSAHADAVAPRLALARLAILTNAADAAETVSAEALALGPDNIDALALHAQALILAGKAGSAESDVNKLHTLASANKNASPRTLVAVANLQRQLGQLDRAHDNLLRAVAAAPTSKEVLVALIQLEVLRGDTAAATTRLDELRKGGADAALVTMLEGDISAASGALDAAAKSYRSLAKDGNRDATLKLAGIQVRAGHNADARSTLITWVKAHPNDFGAEVALASITLSEGDNAAAIAQYEALKQKKADSPIVLNNLAWLYLETKDPRAIDTARAAYALAPHNPEIADTLGWILVQQNAAEEALTYLEVAAAARPNASISYHLAAAYEQVKRTADARRAVDRALSLGQFPERADAQKLRDRL